MRAVAVLIEAETTVVREVLAGDDPPAQLRHQRDARIDHRHTDAGTRQRTDARRPAALLHQVRADRLVRHPHVRFDEVIGRELIDLAVVGDRVQRPRRHLEDCARLELLRNPQPVTRRDPRNPLT